MGIVLKTNSKNLIGKRFGKLTIIDIICSHSKGRGYIWKCKCDCGNITEAYTAKLNGGRKKSCGCLLSGEGHYMWTGYKGMSGYAWLKIKNRSKTENREFTITASDIWNLYEKQNRKCALSGEKITFEHDENGILCGEQTASLDRIDSKKGYTLDNVQWVHKDLNIMKMDMIQDNFIYWCKKIANNFKDKTDIIINEKSRERWKDLSV
jgi:hypothetical protein